MNVNVFGTITLTRLLAPYMLDRGMGHFVVVCINFQQELLVITVSFCLLVWLTHIQMSSAAGKVPAPGQAIYSASKHALNGYFASLRSEVPEIHILAHILIVICISMLSYSLML